MLQGRCQRVIGATKIGLIVVLLLGFSSVSEAKKNNRTARRFGIIAAYFGEPFPSNLSATLAYHLSRLITLQVGAGYSYGTLKGRTLGGAIGFAVPGWNLSPTMGLGFSRFFSDGVLSYRSPLSSQAFSIAPFTSHFYLNLSLIYQSKRGIYLSSGLNYSFNSTVGFLPYFAVGKFF